MLNEGVRRLMNESGKILNLVYEDYEACVEQIAEDLDESYNVGSDTPKDKISDFIDAQCVYVIRSLGNVEKLYRSRWYCSPEWEEEHAFYINLANDLERVDC